MSTQSTFGLPESTKSLPKDNFWAPPNEEFVKSHRYTTLVEDQWEIRLIQLLPCKSSSLVSCRLLDPVSLKTAKPVYVALSYCAGDIHDLTTIVVDGIEFQVFSSLGRALRRLQLTGEFNGETNSQLAIWADQICINQTDLREKSWQVSIMRQIYEKSNITAMYLDLSESGAPSPVPLLALISTLRTQTQKLGEEYVGEYLSIAPENVRKMSLHENAAFMSSQSRLQTRLAADLMQEICNSPEKMCWLTEMAQIWAAPYWSRCWIQQEVVVSSMGVLLTSHECVPWWLFRSVSSIVHQVAAIMGSDNNLPRVCDALNLRPEMLLQKLYPIVYYRNSPVLVDSLHIAWQKFGGSDIRKLMAHARGLKSTDPRDRVYSMLGLANKDYQIPLDYSGSSHESNLFIDVVTQSILQDGCLNVIADANEIERHSDWGLPSWVADYSVKQDRRNLAIHRRPSIFHTKFCATTSLEGECRIRSWDTQSGPIIRARRHTTKVTLLALQIYQKWSPFAENELKPRNIAVWEESVGDLERRHGTSTYCPCPGIEFSEAYNMTVSMGMTVEAIRELVRDLTRHSGSEMATERNVLDEESRETLNSDFHSGYREATSGAWLFFAKEDHGIIGLVPSNTRAGDQLCIIPGTSVPFVVRPLPSYPAEYGDNDAVLAGAHNYILVGAAYVQGYMTGLAVDEIKKGKWSRTEVLLQ